ncbi:DUF58 domain-containing protein [Candidatus Poribacteria bacterium]|nr:DUF58 domain-containing protein [Candidatus Poribacteria bacterium]
MQEQDILKKIQRIDIFSNRLVNTVFAGEYKSFFKGQGLTFDEVREYQEGDEIRTIDWNVTARMGQPFVKKYIEERELVLMLIVDLSASTLFGSIDETKAEIAAEITALLAFSAIRNNDKVGLICFTNTVEHFVPPQKGKKHVLRVVRDILRFQPKHKGTDITQALKFADQILKPHSVIFLISDFRDTDYQKQLRIINKRHTLIAITLEDPRESEMPNVGLIELEDAETGLRKIIDSRSEDIRNEYSKQNTQSIQERQKTFIHSQVESIDIKTNQSYVLPLIRFFRHRSLKN